MKNYNQFYQPQISRTSMSCCGDNPLAATAGAEQAIVVPECLHMLHDACFRQCKAAECPTCRLGVTMTTVAASPSPPAAPRRSARSGGNPASEGASSGSGSASNDSGAAQAAAAVAPSLQSHSDFDLE